MSSKRSFNAFIDRVKKEFFTSQGDAVWKKFVDDVIPAALFGDSGCNGRNTNILKEIACSHSYALEFRIRALFVLCVPDRSLLPVYWPHEKSFFVDMSDFSCPIALNDFVLELFAYCIAFVASEGSQDPCARQSRINNYMRKCFGSQGLKQLVKSAGKDTARRALTVLATVPIISSFDNSLLHPLTNLFEGSFNTELLRYFDRRIRRVVRACVQQCICEQRECNTLNDYVSLVKNCIASAHARRDVQQLISTQISFILRMRREYDAFPKHSFYSLGSHCVPRLFSILHGASFIGLRRDVTLYILETSPELLCVGKNIINDPGSIQGTRAMLESLSPEDGVAIERITTLLDIIEKQNKDIAHNRQEQDKRDKRVKDAFVAASNSALAAMRQSIPS